MRDSVMKRFLAKRVVIERGARGQSDMGDCSDGAGHDKGFFRLQKMLPQSCQGQGAPNGRIHSVDGVQYKSITNPISEMLLRVFL